MIIEQTQLESLEDHAFIDDYRVYKKVLTTDDINKIYNNTEDLVYNYHNFVGIIDDTLKIEGNYRNIAYDISVTASNTVGSVNWNLSVTEEEPGKPYTTGLYEIEINYGKYNLPIEANLNGLYLTYEIISNPYNNVLLKYGAEYYIEINANYRGTTYDIILEATNTSGKSQFTYRITEEIPEPPDVEPNILLTLSNNTVVYNLNDYFSGHIISFSELQDNYNNASIIGSNLYITGDYRDIEYDIIVQATNAYGSTPWLIQTTELLRPPEVTNPSTKELVYGDYIYNLNDYVIGNKLIYSISQNPYSNITLDSSNLTVNANYRDNTYNILIDVTNNAGSDTLTLGFTEVAPRRPDYTDKSNISLLLSNNEVVYDLSELFMYLVESYNIKSNIYGNATLSNTNLTIDGNYRYDTYDVVVEAVNIYGSTEFTFNIEELLKPLIKPTIVENDISVNAIQIGTTNDYYYAFTSTSGNNSIQFLEDTVCDILVVGGGGSGGGQIGGGGGAGGIVYIEQKTLSSGTYTITIGAGGASKSGGVDGDNGGNSQITYNSTVLTHNGFNVTGKGGGGGGNYIGNAYGTYGKNGGSGGGAGENNASSTLYGGSATQGNTLWNGTTFISGGGGGRSNTNQQNFRGRGGGAVGSNGTREYDGTNGFQIDITGTNQYYAGGGGGALAYTGSEYSAGTAEANRGKGGNGGGGDGAWCEDGAFPGARGVNGIDGTGGGGGGGGWGTEYSGGPATNYSGSGGSGIVIIRFSERIF